MHYDLVSPSKLLAGIVGVINIL